eukprot:TRINITY_DN27146_c0_g1_i1.p1 TRINITY_DN27146_c0_g1~~TRINITY_DN27146_c0_g1_i1.p1  ORF type:complete len:541 (+),score=84.37 TRINITY_DN27146_c0_g1_i1:41-1663(+)
MECKHLSHGVAQLHVWYQIACLALVLLLMWYDEEVSAAFPPYKGFVQVFIDPIFDALSIDMYLSADYRELFEGLMLRHKMLMIARTVILGSVFVVLRRFSKEEEQIIKRLTVNAFARYVLQAMDLLEVLFVLQSFATKKLMMDMIPNLAKGTTDNLATPAIKWATLISNWWLAQIVPSSMIALLYRSVVLLYTKQYAPGNYGVRYFMLAFQISRLVVVVFWGFVATDRSYLNASRHVAALLFAKAIVVHVIVNLQNQSEAVTDGHPQEKTVPWNREELSIVNMVVIYTNRFKILLLQPLILMLGCSMVMLSANTIALLVVILVMYLTLVWFPAALSVLSLDFITNASAMMSFCWLFKFSSGWWEPRNVELSLMFFTLSVLSLTQLSFTWRGAGLPGVFILFWVCVAIQDTLTGLAVDSSRPCLSEADEERKFKTVDILMASIIVCAGLVGMTSLVTTPKPSQLIRMYTHSLWSTACLSVIIVVSYLIPITFVPSAAHTPLIILHFLLFLGVMKENEAGMRLFIDRALFNIEVNTQGFMNE